MAIKLTKSRADKISTLLINTIFSSPKHLIYPYESGNKWTVRIRTKFYKPYTIRMIKKTIGDHYDIWVSDFSDRYGRRYILIKNRRTKVNLDQDLYTGKFIKN